MGLTGRQLDEYLLMVEAKWKMLDQWKDGHPAGTGKASKPLRGMTMAHHLETHKMVMEEVILDERMTWAHVLQLKFFQVMAEEDPRQLKRLLLELAGVVMVWAEEAADTTQSRL